MGHFTAVPESSRRWEVEKCTKNGRSTRGSAHCCRSRPRVKKRRQHEQRHMLKTSIRIKLTVQFDIAIKCSLIQFSIYQWTTESTLSRAIITREKKTHQSSREKCSPVHKNTRVNNLDDMHHWTSYRARAASRSRLLSIMCEFLN